MRGCELKGLTCAGADPSSLVLKRGHDGTEFGGYLYKSTLVRNAVFRFCKTKELQTRERESSQLHSAIIQAGMTGCHH